MGGELVESLPEFARGSGVGLDPADLVAIGVPVERGERLQEGRQVLRRRQSTTVPFTTDTPVNLRVRAWAE